MDFKAFLQGQRSALEKSLNAIVPGDIAARVGLRGGEWIERIAGESKVAAGGEESRLALAEAEVSSDYRNVIKLEEEAGIRRDYKTAEWAKRRANTIASEDVLSFLSRKVVIPKYGFPVDVVELDTQRVTQNQETSQVSLQRDLSIAISEFAPTSQLVANKKVWTSYGLKKVAEKEWERKSYKRCARHNIFLEWEVNDPEPPTPCEDRPPVLHYIIPRFGFVTNRDKPKDPSSRPVRVFTTRPYFAYSLAPEADTIEIPDKVPLISVKKASPALMVVLSEGRRGTGFYVCVECGAGFRRREKTHLTPLGPAMQRGARAYLTGAQVRYGCITTSVPSPTGGTHRRHLVRLLARLRAGRRCGRGLRSAIHRFECHCRSW